MTEQVQYEAYRKHMITLYAQAYAVFTTEELMVKRDKLVQKPLVFIAVELEAINNELEVRGS